MFAMTLVMVIMILVAVIVGMQKKIERLHLKLRIERLSAANARMTMIQMEECMNGDTQEYVVDPKWFDGCNENNTVAG